MNSFFLFFFPFFFACFGCCTVAKFRGTILHSSGIGNFPRCVFLSALVASPWACTTTHLPSPLELSWNPCYQMILWQMVCRTEWGHLSVLSPGFCEHVWFAELIPKKSWWLWLHTAYHYECLLQSTVRNPVQGPWNYSLPNFCLFLVDFEWYG